MIFPMLRFLRGFSLIEVILTVGILSSLMTAVLSAISPAYILAKTRNSQRWTHINDLLGAFAVYTIDNDGYTPPNVQIPATQGSVIFSGAYVIEPSIMSPRAITVVDIDSDGTIEVVGTASQGNSKDVSVWERSGTAPNFTWARTAVDSSNWHGYDVAVGDMDGDGLKDIVSVYSTGRGIAWWRNLGGAPAAFDARRNIETNYAGVKSLALANFDNATGMDVAVASSSILSSLFYPVRWYENDGTPLNGGWNTVNIQQGGWGFATIRQIIAVDIDQDLNTDVVVAESWRYLLGAFSDEHIQLYRNDGTPEGASWTKLAVDNGENGERGVAAADIDGDLDTDLLGIGLSGKVEWYENDGTPFTGAWTSHTVTSSFGGETITAGDMDGDGDLAIVAASYGGDKIAYWQNLGGGTFSGTFVVAFGAALNGVSDIELVDMDGDTDLDIVAANTNANTVSWWMNLFVNGVSQPAPQAGLQSDYKPICRGGISVASCDAYGGVALVVLVPGHIASIPVDPSQDDDDAGTGATLTGFEISIDSQGGKLWIRAPLAELGETIELIGPIGTENCLVWDVVQGERTCVLFE